MQWHYLYFTGMLGVFLGTAGCESESSENVKEPRPMPDPAAITAYHPSESLILPTERDFWTSPSDALERKISPLEQGGVGIADSSWYQEVSDIINEREGPLVDEVQILRVLNLLLEQVEAEEHNPSNVYMCYKTLVDHYFSRNYPYSTIGFVFVKRAIRLEKTLSLDAERKLLKFPQLNSILMRGCMRQIRFLLYKTTELTISDSEIPDETLQQLEGALAIMLEITRLVSKNDLKALSEVNLMVNNYPRAELFFSEIGGLDRISSSYKELIAWRNGTLHEEQ